MISEIGNTQRTGYTASKIFHMYRNERHLFDNTYKFLLVHNYINWYHLVDENYNFFTLSRKDFNKMYIRELKMWLKKLGYGRLSKLRKKELYEMVVKYNEEINLL